MLETNRGICLENGKFETLIKHQEVWTGDIDLSIINICLILNVKGLSQITKTISID